MPTWELPLIAFAGVSLGILPARLVRMLLAWRRRRRKDEALPGGSGVVENQPTMVLAQQQGVGEYHSLSRHSAALRGPPRPSAALRGPAAALRGPAAGPGTADPLTPAPRSVAEAVFAAGARRV